MELSLAERLRLSRQKAGLSQKQIAEKLGISAKAWQNYETGKRKPRDEIVLRAAGACGISPAELLGSDDWPVLAVASPNGGKFYVPGPGQRTYLPVFSQPPAQLPVSVRPDAGFREIEPSFWGLERYFLVFGGDTMTPELLSGDLLLVAHVSTSLPLVRLAGRICVFAQEDSYIAGRVVLVEANGQQRVMLRPANPEHPPVELTQANAANVRGKIVGIAWREL